MARQNLPCHCDIGEGVLAGVVDLPSDKYQPPTGFQLVLRVDEPAEAERVFQALAKEGTVPIPLRKTFWAARYAMVTDQFGVPWEINCATNTEAAKPIRDK